METWLEHWLPSLSWLNFSSPGAVAEFSAHFAWGLAGIFIAYAYGGRRWVKRFVGVWLAYSVYKEYFEDGHFFRLLAHTEPLDEAKDFVTDLISRISPLVIGPKLLPAKRKVKRND